jgi:mono/diheme cytochrome c family protein
MATVFGALLAALLPAAAVRADRDEESESRSEHEHDSEHDSGQERRSGAALPAQTFRSAPAADASLTADEGQARYRAECSSCHIAYPPGLLPAASWRALMAGLDRHFQQNAELDPAAAAPLTAWLAANAAEAGTHPKSQKVLRSLGGEAPLRISEVPYIRHEHHELRPSVFSGPAIGSLANCSACHSEAEQGVFDEAGVRIPK